jgi:hypothetical protein
MNKDIEYYYFMKLLNDRFEKPRLINTNMHFHRLIETNAGRYYLVHKKDHFHAFNAIFKNYIDDNNTLSGIGESINIEYLQFAINYNAMLVFSYEMYEHIFYVLDRNKLITLLRYKYPELNNENVQTEALLKIYCEIYNLKREQDKSNTYKKNDYSESTVILQERTYSFPMKMMKRWN